jgi:phthalate 4,5-dioxygenase oxygenase subunit
MMPGKDDNEPLTRVGRGTPLGNFLRQYWHPVLLVSELPHPDCDQLRVRVLGEDLIAFRDTAGRVGFLGERCPHRRASFFFGRNEEGGIRCAYHGWKFDVDGRCLDMPNELPERKAKDRLRHTAYQACERGGAIWIYMGDERPAPPLPGLEWIDVPAEQRYQSKRVQRNNWLQALEGDIDQSHVGFAHRRLDRGGTVSGRPAVDKIRASDTHPTMTAEDMPYGVLIGAGRVAAEDQRYWRLTQYLFPHWVMTGPYGENPTRHARAWVPIDDHSTLLFTVTFHPLQPLSAEAIAVMRKGSGAGYVGEENFLPPTSEAFGAWIPKASMQNDFFLDRAVQKTTHYSGIGEFWAQDAALQESMGSITDRSEEHLVTGDIGIVRVRRRLLNVVLAMQEEQTPAPAVHEPAAYQVRGAAVLLPAEASWIDATAEHRKVIPGINQAGV